MGVIKGDNRSLDYSSFGRKVCRYYLHWAIWMDQLFQDPVAQNKARVRVRYWSRRGTGDVGMCFPSKTIPHRNNRFRHKCNVIVIVEYQNCPTAQNFKPYIPPFTPSINAMLQRPSMEPSFLTRSSCWEDILGGPPPHPVKVTKTIRDTFTTIFLGPSYTSMIPLEILNLIP